MEEKLSYEEREKMLWKVIRQVTEEERKLIVETNNNRVKTYNAIVELSIVIRTQRKAVSDFWDIIHKTYCLSPGYRYTIDEKTGELMQELEIDDVDFNKKVKK